MLITVFTPTYNRAHLLPRLYVSLCKQTFKDFEWLIVDDGSTDGTETVVEDFRKQGKIDIRYIKKTNEGKHIATNLGVWKAKGELFFIADSDDLLLHDSLQNVEAEYERIRFDNSFGGVCGLDGTFDGRIIGSGLPKDIVETSSLDIRMRYNVIGDMKEVFKTRVLYDFHFPEIEGETFCPEVLIWNRIAKEYKLRFFNKIIYLAEYQDDGISAGIVKARMQSPIASMMTYAEMTEYAGVPIMQKAKAAINYWRFRFCVKNKKVSMVDTDWGTMPTVCWWWRCFLPLGWAMHRRDVRKVKRKR